VEHADLFVAFSAPAYKRFFDLCTGYVLYDPELVEAVRPEAPERHVAVPATQLAKERLGNVLFANMVMLGAVTRLAGMDYAAMQATMLEIIPRFREQNLQALELGHGLPVALLSSPA
jgi:2-oxoglutarate ferredoxin oxidoreductase subunit gamma